MQNEDTGAARQPVEYIVKEKSLIGNQIYEPGAKVEYDGLPSENLEPTCDVGRARYQEYLRSDAERVAKLREQYSESAVGDPAEFAAKFATELQKSNEEFQRSIAGVVAEAVAQAVAAMFPNGVGAPAAQALAPAADAPVTAKPAGKGKAGQDGESLV